MTQNKTLSVSLESTFYAFSNKCVFFTGSCALFTGPVSIFLAKITLKLGPKALFTHLKIILLQCFQFSVISDIQTNPN